MGRRGHRCRPSICQGAKRGPGRRLIRCLALMPCRWLPAWPCVPPPSPPAPAASLAPAFSAKAAGSSARRAAIAAQAKVSPCLRRRPLPPTAPRPCLLRQPLCTRAAQRQFMWQQHSRKAAAFGAACLCPGRRGSLPPGTHWAAGARQHHHQAAGAASPPRALPFARSCHAGQHPATSAAAQGAAAATRSTHPPTQPTNHPPLPCRLACSPADRRHPGGVPAGGHPRPQAAPSS